MTHQPETRQSLIIRLPNARDEVAWAEFLSLYEPLILRLMRKQGLQNSDARDVCQQVLAAVARDVNQWKPDGGQASFRRWLFQVARNRLLKFLAKRRTEPRAAGGTEAQIKLESQPDDPGTLANAWEREYRQELLAWGADQIRGEFQPPTWQAFWRTCVNGEPVAKVAAELGTSAGNVYVARSRIIARLREKISEVEDDGV
jgi:RNA polymerase sigma-70 factor (ECF subfamily)